MVCVNQQKNTTILQTLLILAQSVFQLTTDAISLLSPKFLEVSSPLQQLSLGIAFKTVVTPTTTTTTTPTAT